MIKIFICFYIFLINEQFLFYLTMKIYCKKNLGRCINCSCWSCPRKKYIDEYKIHRFADIISKTKFKEGP